MFTKSTRHSVFDLQYHIAWCPKYRNAVLDGQVEIELKKIIAESCAHYGWGLEEIEVMPDHVHLLVSADPDTRPNEIAKTLKSISAVKLFSEFPTLKKKKFWGSGLWSSSTYYGSVGHNDEEVIRKYIQSQKIRG